MLKADEKLVTRYFDDVEDPLALTRYATLNHYPNIENIDPERKAELEEGYVRGIQSHRDDFNFITTLIADAGGLEVLSHDGKWVDVPHIEGTVVVNLGLLLTELSGGLLQATIHRVNSLKVKNRGRISCPYFLIPAPDVPFIPIPHNLPIRPAVADPALVLANTIQDRSLRYVHRRMAILYKVCCHSGGVFCGSSW
jgi:isopenicillin N synthase-like dioxygenase